jgi:hypothetical protein
MVAPRSKVRNSQFRDRPLDLAAAAAAAAATAVAAEIRERMTGIEPALSAWEAEVLPLNYIRVRHPECGPWVKRSKRPSKQPANNNFSCQPRPTLSSRAACRCRRKLLCPRPCPRTPLYPRGARCRLLRGAETGCGYPESLRPAGAWPCEGGVQKPAAHVAERKHAVEALHERHELEPVHGARRVDRHRPRFRRALVVDAIVQLR